MFKGSMSFRPESSVVPFFRKLQELSIKDPNAAIFLTKWVEVCWALQSNWSDLSEDKSIKSRTLHELLSSFDRIFFKLYIRPIWRKEEIEAVTPLYKRIVEEAIMHATPLMDGGLLEEIQALDHKALRLLQFIFTRFLYDALPISEDISQSLSDKEKELVFISIYLSSFLELDQSSSEKRAEGICFYLALGILFRISEQLWARVLEANRADPKDRRTQVSAPIIYIILELARREGAKDEWADRETYITIQKEALRILNEGAEMATKGIFHPDDPEQTKRKKFLTPIEKEQLEIGGTEAESLFYELVSKKLKKHFSSITTDELFEEMYKWNKDLAGTPNAFYRDLVNEIEGNEAKKHALTVEELRERREAINLLKELVGKGKASPMELDQAQKEFEELIMEEIGVAHTDREDFEGVPNGVVVLNETMPEYSIKDPEKDAISNERKN